MSCSVFCIMQFSLFLVEVAFVAVRTEQQSFNPRRGSAHLIADGIQGYIGAALDDEFIVDVADNLAEA